MLYNETIFVPRKKISNEYEKKREKTIKNKRDRKILFTIFSRFLRKKRSKNKD